MHGYSDNFLELFVGMHSSGVVAILVYLFRAYRASGTFSELIKICDFLVGTYASLLCMYMNLFCLLVTASVYTVYLI